MKTCPRRKQSDHEKKFGETLKIMTIQKGIRYGFKFLKSKPEKKTN